MSHITGRGRYARETYPQANNAVAGAIIQTGFDQVETDDDLAILPTSGAIFFPRNEASDPLSVTLPGVTPGNYLEVDFRACVQKNGSYYYEQQQVVILLYASFDGNPPVLVPSATTYLLQDGTTGHRDVGVTLEGASQPVVNMTALVSVPIPSGATTAIVQVVLATTAGIIINGTTDPGETELSTTLKCTELNAARVSQPGPGTAIPTGP